MNTWGAKLKLSIFGESHGRAIGIVVDGLPPGEAVDLEAVAGEMARRAPGGALATPRREGDRVEILSGLHDGKTTGFPLCGVIQNSDARPGDYGAALRPGHADWTALLKYGGHADMRGGGHFSGRLTAPLVFAGALAKQVLARRGAAVHGRIAAVGGIQDAPLAREEALCRAVGEKPFPVGDDKAGEAMAAAILAAKADGDSLGGVVEAVAFGLPGGLGEPFFGSVESAAASLLFSVPAVKAVEFGDGLGLAAMRGSQANDPIVLAQGEMTAASNHNGGVLGGITNGMPLVVRAAFKPTPTIGKEQDTVDPTTGKPVKLAGRGRHDPCIVPRAVPVVEAALALCVLDLILQGGGEHA